MPPDLALLSTLIGSNFPCLEQIFMVRKVFEPLKFYCSLNNSDFGKRSKNDLDLWYYILYTNLYIKVLNNFQISRYRLLFYIVASGVKFDIAAKGFCQHMVTKSLPQLDRNLVPRVSALKFFCHIWWVWRPYLGRLMTSE